MPRWLGIDHGTKRIGVAVGGTEDALAGPVEMIPARPAEPARTRIAQIAAEYGCAGIVVGWPLNMDDTEGPQGTLARQFAATLADETGLDVRLWDERLSSFHADQALAQTYTRKKKRARQDAIAAAAILQDFLNAGAPDDAPTPHSASAPPAEN